MGGDPFTSGVIIARVARGSYAQRVGFQAGDVVAAINDRPVTSPATLDDIGRGAQVTINRGGQQVIGVMR